MDLPLLTLSIPHPPEPVPTAMVDLICIHPVMA
jgi:hypothetical protein